MDNLKKYNQFINEMVDIQSEKEFIFNRKEIHTLETNEVYEFNIVSNNKALFEIPGKYRITIYKRKTDFYFRIRDLKKGFNPVIYESSYKDLNYCLSEIDEYMWNRLKIDKEKEALAKKLEKERLERLERGEEEKPNDVFAGRSFGGKFNM